MLNAVRTFLIQLGFCVFVAAVGLLVYYVVQYDPYSWDRLDSQSKLIPHGLVPVHLPFLLKPLIQAEQSQMFRQLVSCLNETNTAYWLTRETLLYAINTKELVPWNDCLSIAILETDVEKFKGVVKNKLSQYTLKWDTKTLCGRDAMIHIEICNEASYMTIYSSLSKIAQTYSKTEIFPLQTITMMNDLQVTVPKESGKILEVMFGINYKTYFPTRIYLMHAYNTYSKQHFESHVKPYIPFLCGL
jgi:hypothetical protein